MPILVDPTRRQLPACTLSIVRNHCLAAQCKRFSSKARANRGTDMHYPKGAATALAVVFEAVRISCTGTTPAPSRTGGQKDQVSFDITMARIPRANAG